MNIIEFNTFVPLIVTSGYVLLFVASLVRRSQKPRLTRWFWAFLLLSIVWEFLLILGSGTNQLASWSIKVLLIGSTLLGIIAAINADWGEQIEWLLVGSGTVLLAMAIDLAFPGVGIRFPDASSIRLTYGNLFAHLFWLALCCYVLIRSWREFRQTIFPWHANRLLFWVIVLLLVYSGEAMLFFRWSGLTIAGQIIRFIGVIGLANAISSHRILDVRARFQRLLAMFIITLISGLPVAGVIAILQWLAKEQSISTIILLTATTVTVGFFFYQPYRRFVERIAFRYLPGQEIAASKVVRDYSQAVYKTLDVNQLAVVITSTLSQLLGTNRGALMLVSETSDGLEIEPVASLSQASYPKIRLSSESPFIEALRQHQPLLQYEIDFNPDYVDLDPSERTWLKELAMEVYVPVSTDTVLAGMIAIGPTNSGHPYQPGELELVQILADQTVVALQNSRLYSELADQNEKIRYLNVDLTNQNERLEIMDRVKSDFIAIASHELRTPLTQVKGYTDILETMNEENALTVEQTRGILGHISQASERLDVLISAMLDTSELDIDGMKLTVGLATIETIIREAVAPLQLALRERRISLDVHGINALPPIYADSKRLVQAFTNLIGNAIKYTPDHSHVDIQGMSLPSRDDKEAFVEVIIADKGIGIDPKFHELIFEKFFRVGDPQLHSTSETKFKGAGPGLGLPIAKGVIEAHGGRIWVESEGEDEQRLPGSRFHVILPVRPPATDTD
jgi:signal transduction histidine kinase